MTITVGALALTLAGIGIAPVFAQDGPFKDVPNDHWAYQAIERLAKDKVFIGDTDGKFAGKRALTRYELAMVVDRIVRSMDERYVKAPLPEVKQVAAGVSMDQVQDLLGGYAKKSDIPMAAKPVDLSGLAKQSDIDMIRKMVAEFQTELTTLGVDTDKAKKTLDNHEKRIAALEAANKNAVKISGVFNAYIRGNFGVSGLGAVDMNSSVIDEGATVLGTSNVFHDLDVNISAPSVDVTLNFGNYLPALGSIAQYASGTSAQGQTIYKAVYSTKQSVPVLGTVGAQIGRVPSQMSSLTFKSYDVDYYFNNSKTDNGNYLVDGLNASFKLGPFAITALAGKTDPIANSAMSTGDPLTSYGIRAGVVTPLGFDRADQVGAPNSGGIVVTRVAGARAGFKVFSLPVGVSTLLAAGDSNGTFDQVNVYGTDVKIKLFGLDVNGEYAESNTRLGGTNIAVNNNAAYNVSTKLSNGSWTLSGGYKEIEPLFGAPGSWGRMGTNVNPVDIKGGYGTWVWTPTAKLEVTLGMQDYKGTDKGGNTSDQTSKWNMSKLSYKLGSTSTFSVSQAETKYADAGALQGRETFTNYAYAKTLSATSTFRLLYQVVSFNDGTADTQKGGTLATQFSVKF